MIEQADRERLEDLLVARAVEGLDARDAAELDVLLMRIPDAAPERYDEAAACFWLGAGDPPARALPPGLAGRVGCLLEEPGETPPPRPPPPDTTGGGARWRSPPGWHGARSVWLAAAAALALAVAGWWPRLDQPDAAKLAESRAELMARAPDAVRAEWEATDEPRARDVSGYVVWSDRLQRGFMTFRDIPANDPSERQYQLWVYDHGRDEKHPVDGGVFNAPADGGEVIVPIENRLPVEQAEQFAVTLEPAGGAAVPDREPLLLLARPDETSS